MPNITNQNNPNQRRQWVPANQSQIRLKRTFVLIVERKSTSSIASRHFLPQYSIYCFIPNGQTDIQRQRADGKGERRRVDMQVAWESEQKRKSRKRDSKKDRFADMNFHFSSTCWHSKSFKKLHFWSFINVWERMQGQTERACQNQQQGFWSQSYYRKTGEPLSALPLRSQHQRNTTDSVSRTNPVLSETSSCTVGALTLPRAPEDRMKSAVWYVWK